MIISMVDRLKDNEDKKLESLFRLEPVRDDGFSSRVVTRLKRRLWIRRLTLPVAFVLGAAVALKPLSQLVVTFSKLLLLLPVEISGFSLSTMPQASTVMLGGLFLVAMLMITKMLED
jgi:hypothetical protein